jgi:hypothetical protein
MAISKPIENVPTSTQEGTWRTNLETPSNGAHSIQFYRETVALDASDNVVGSPSQSLTPINRLFDDVNDETVPIAGGQLSFAEVIEALAQFADRWAAEDEVAPAAFRPSSFQPK